MAAVLRGRGDEHGLAIVEVAKLRVRHEDDRLVLALRAAPPQAKTSPRTAITRKKRLMRRVRGF